MTDVDVGVATPVVPASTDAPAPKSTADSVVENPTGDKPESKTERTFTQKEVNEIAARRAAQAERSALKIARAEARAESAERQLQDRARPQSEASGEPKQKDFTDYEEYLLARAEWRFEQKQAKQRETQERDSTAQQEGRQHAERARQFQDTVLAKGRAKYEDFDAVALDESTPVTPAMGAAIMRLPTGHDVLQHLGENRAEALRIANLPDIEQVWEIKALEAKLKAPPKPTNTPAPIVPNGSASAGNKKDWKEMSTEEHVKAYRAQKKRS